MSRVPTRCEVVGLHVVVPAAGIGENFYEVPSVEQRPFEIQVARVLVRGGGNRIVQRPAL